MWVTGWSLKFSLIVSLFPLSASLAEPVKLVGYDVAPLVRVTDGKKLLGLGLRLCRRNVQGGWGRVYGRRATFARAMTSLEDGNTVGVLLERFSGPRRKIYLDYRSGSGRWLCFVRPKAEPVITSLDQARALKSIAALEGSSALNMLNVRGFTQVDAASSYSMITRKVIAGRNDAWLSTAVVSRQLLRESPGAADTLALGPVLAPIPLWVVGSPSLSPEIAAKLRASAETLKTSGRYAASPRGD